MGDLRAWVCRIPGPVLRLWPTGAAVRTRFPSALTAGRPASMVPPPSVAPAGGPGCRHGPRRTRMMPRSPTLWGLAGLALLALAAPARAEYVTRTYLFDQSNRLPDGIVFGGVTIEAYDGTGDAGGGLAA